MNNPVIPAEAVEAAAKIMHERKDTETTFRDVARAALEAAAPHMLANAWDEGGEAAIEREHTYGAEEKAKFANPYRSKP